MPVGRYKGNKHMFIIAVLGDGGELPSGTGYALVDVYNPVNANSPHTVYSWHRWKSGYGSPTGDGVEVVEGQGCLSLQASVPAHRRADWINPQTLPSSSEMRMQLP